MDTPVVLMMAFAGHVGFDNFVDGENITATSFLFFASFYFFYVVLSFGFWILNIPGGSSW